MKGRASRSHYVGKRLFYRLLSIIVLFVLLGGVFEAIRLVQLHLEERDLQEEIDRLRRENHDMEEMRKRLAEDPREIEKRAREDLGMIKEGDTIFRVIRPRSREEGVEESKKAEGLDRSKRTR